jgi:hypothetical protein
VTVNDIAKACATEIESRRWNHRVGEAELSAESVQEWVYIVTKHFAPLAEQNDRLLGLVRIVRQWHKINELKGTPSTWCQCTVCRYMRPECEADGKGTT